MKIILVNPLIPQNTGSIGRVCAAMGTELILVEPLGFKLEDRYLKRAGLDYWPWIKLRVFPSWEALEGEVSGRRWLFSARARRSYCDVEYREDDCLVFGSETDGLPDTILESLPAEQRIHIPIENPNVRSINLAQCAAVGLCEARRQVGFPPHQRRSALLPEH